jgi:hypothetical protein
MGCFDSFNEQVQVVVYASDGWTPDLVFKKKNSESKKHQFQILGEKSNLQTARSGYFKILKEPVVFMKLGGYIGLQKCKTPLSSTYLHVVTLS